MERDLDQLKVPRIIKGTAVTTAVILMIVLQITVFRAFGDLVSSFVIFGCGYAAAKLRV